MSEVPLVLSVRFPIKPDQRERFLELSRAAVASTRKEPGCISYTFYEDGMVPNAFIFFEEWRSEEALVSHIKQPYIQPLLEAFPEILDGDVDLRRYYVSRVTHGIDDLM